MSETTTSAAPATSNEQVSSNGPVASGGQGVESSKAAASTSSPDWTSSLNEDLRGFVQNKGFKDPSMVVDSYRNLEKLMGVPKERLLKIPEKEDDAAWGDIYSRLGRPEKPSEYKIPLPKEGANKEFEAWAQNSFHELGLSRKQGEKLAEKWNGYVQGLSEAQQKAYDARMESDQNSLKKEWGAAFEQNVNAAKRAAREFGMTGDMVDAMEKAMGFSGVMKFLHTVGAKVGEDAFVSGGKSSQFNGVMTPEQAKNKINTLRQDSDFVRRYTSGDSQSRQEMEILHKWAYGSETN